MRIIEPSFTIEAMPDAVAILQLIEAAGRTCYKSEQRTTADSAERFVSSLMKKGHESVIEHVCATVRFLCDRGVTHELVRHRLAAYSQESTRYANYAKDKFDNEITVIRPFFWEEGSDQYACWKQAMLAAEQHYLALVNAGAKAQEARAVLPNSLKTDIVMTANLREWRHVLTLRCAQPAHPQIRQIMLPLLKEFALRLPVLFDDIYQQLHPDNA